jgi:hypothetical protein
MPGVRFAITQKEIWPMRHGIGFDAAGHPAATSGNGVGLSAGGARQGPGQLKPLREFLSGMGEPIRTLAAKRLPRPQNATVGDEPGPKQQFRSE